MPEDNSGTATQTKEGTAGGDTGKGAEGGKSGAGETHAPGAVAVEVDGIMQYLTPGEIGEQLKARDDKLERAAEKVRGADATLKERSDARHAVEFHGLVVKANDGDISALEKLAANFPESGIKPEQVAQHKASLAAGGDVGATGATDGDGDGQGPVRHEDLDEDLQEDITEGRHDRAVAKAREVSGKLMKLLDSDAVIGDTMNDEQFVGAAKRAREAAINVLKRRATASRKGAKWAPTAEDYQDAVQEARQFMADLGYVDVESKEGHTTVPTPRKPPQVPTVGRSPGVPRATHHRKTDRPERLPDAKGAEADVNFTDRFNAGMDEMARSPMP